MQQMAQSLYNDTNNGWDVLWVWVMGGSGRIMRGALWCKICIICHGRLLGCNRIDGGHVIHDVQRVKDYDCTMFDCRVCLVSIFDQILLIFRSSLVGCDHVICLHWLCILRDQIHHTKFQWRARGVPNFLLAWNRYIQAQSIHPLYQPSL